MNRSRDALLEVRNLEYQLLFGQTPELHQDPELQLLGFCLRQLGERQLTLEPLPGASMAELFDHNDILHRRIDAPRDAVGQECPLLVVFEADGGRPLALYRKGGRNWFYCANRQRHWPATRHQALAEEAYEIYRSLPVILPGPLSLLGFTFGTEIGALLALLITSAAAMLFNLSIPMLTNLLVNRILPQSDQQLLLQGLMVVVLLVIGSVATQFLQNLMMLRLESVADLSSRVNAITELRQLLGSGVLSTLLSSLFALSYFLLMFTYDAQLALWGIVFTTVAIGVLLWITLRSIRLQRPLLESGAEITNFSLQAVMGMPQIRSAGAEPFVLLRWLREVNRYALLQLRNNVYSDALEQFGTLLTPLASLLLFAVVVERILHSQSSAELSQTIVAFISFNAAFTSFNGAVTGAVNLVATVGGKAAVLWQRAEPVMLAEVEQGYQPEACRA